MNQVFYKFGFYVWTCSGIYEMLFFQEWIDVAIRTQDTDLEVPLFCFFVEDLVSFTISPKLLISAPSDQPLDVSTCYTKLQNQGMWNLQSTIGTSCGLDGWMLALLQSCFVLVSNIIFVSSNTAFIFGICSLFILEMIIIYKASWIITISNTMRVQWAVFPSK